MKIIYDKLCKALIIIQDKYDAIMLDTILHSCVLRCAQECHILNCSHMKLS